MRIKGITDEDFVNYKFPSMFISTITCSWKCCRDAGVDPSICQNHSLFSAPSKDVPDHWLVQRYISNPITHAIVFGGLEPLDQFDELLALVKEFRASTDDDIVIYTGYYPTEVPRYIRKLQKYPNIIMKYGRYIPNQVGMFDDVPDPVLGIKLASSNQYGERIS